MTRLLLGALVALVLSASALAQSSQDLRRVVLVNGDVYVGVVANENADPVVVTTTDGVERRFPRSQVDFVAPLINGRFFRTDPVKTRFFVAPTARTLGGGEFRGDLTYIFPSITAGLSDRVDLLASGLIGGGTGGDGDGLFFTPLVGLKAQVWRGDGVQVALGTSVQVQFSSESSLAALPYGVVTLGDETSAITFGVGAAIGAVGGDVDVADGILYGIGAERQINNGVKLFVEALGTIGLGGPTETCFDDGFGQTVCFEDNDRIDEGLLILPGVRFFGNKFAFDVIGAIATDFDSLVGFAPVGARASYGF